MTALRPFWTALKALAIFTIVLGVVYPLAITAISQVAFPAQANGSLLTEDDSVVGSALIGQSFSDEDGVPLPGWFQSRPSAAGDGYDGGASSGSNLGPENPDLVAAITERRLLIAEANGVSPDEVPADAVTASASGLDPHISPEFARLQVDRVAEQRGLPVAEVSRLVESMIQGRDIGFLGEPTVNVVRLNVALSGMVR